MLVNKMSLILKKFIAENLTSIQKNLTSIQKKLTSFVVACRCLGSYQVESTGSRPIPEVKQPRAKSVPGRETAWEHLVS